MNANSESEAFTDFTGDAPASGPTPGSLGGRLLRRLLSELGDPPVEFILWSGERIAPASSTPAIKIRVHDRATLLRVVRDPQVQFGDAYADGRVAPAEIPAGIIAYRSKPVTPPPVTLALLQRGQERYRIYCTPCHSELGDGPAGLCGRV